MRKLVRGKNGPALEQGSVAVPELSTRTLRKAAPMRQSLQIRNIRAEDNARLRKVILQVLDPFVGERPGFANADLELADMHANYRSKGRRYFVALVEGRIAGGAGIAELEGGHKSVCELRKMYVLPKCQGIGIGRKLLELCLAFAQKSGYSQCYLETLKCMDAANALYDSFGFKDLNQPLGETGHHGCDRWRVLDL